MTPLGENYYGDLFINAMTDYAELPDLQALPNGLIAQMQVGSSFTQFDQSPEQLTAIAKPEPNPEDDFLFTFDASYTADQNGLIGGNATYTWDFGDGTQASGLAVSHRFNEPGEHQVTLIVTKSDGSIDTAVATAYVPDPVLLSIEFGQGGPVENSSYEADISFCVY